MLSPKQPAALPALDRLQANVTRLGTVLTPDGSPNEAMGILNPAATRTPHGDLLLYPRCVAKGNISRVGTVAVRQEPNGFSCERLGYALEPQAPYEIRPHPGYGCEDPRVTYIPDARIVCDGVHRLWPRRTAHRDRDLAGCLSLGPRRSGALRGLCQRRRRR